MASVLVVGGAGYVGSACTAFLLDRGHDVTIVDDLSTGHRYAALAPRFYENRIGDRAFLKELLGGQRFDVVMHFAAKSLVAESVKHPEMYFENNVEQTRVLLEVMAETGHSKLVFSSTCAIFGDPQGARIREDTPQNPLNPYGESKRRAEQLMREFARDRGLQAIALRYFNAAGAERGLRVGEHHEPETHLIPNVLRAAWDGGRVDVFGTDYATRDGTCVRDYVSVRDLAEAHEAAITRLLSQSKGGSFEGINIGSENGYTVREVIEACRRATGRAFEVIERPRRPGDPPELVADSGLARGTLGYKPGRTDLTTIIDSAWRWEQARRERKRAVFLDRDGTLNWDPGYLGDPSQMRLLEGVGPALRKLQDAGYWLIVVSNQSGVGRGLITESQVRRVNERLDQLLAPFGVRISQYELCFHRPEDACACRKPSPKLLQDAATRYGIDLSRSYMVGDKDSDLEAGRAAGVREVFAVGQDKGDLAQAVDLLLG